eukprot:1045176-Pelagomonas_calceolata.AAC.7
MAAEVCTHTGARCRACNNHAVATSCVQHSVLAMWWGMDQTEDFFAAQLLDLGNAERHEATRAQKSYEGTDRVREENEMAYVILRTHSRCIPATAMTVDGK